MQRQTPHATRIEIIRPNGIPLPAPTTKRDGRQRKKGAGTPNRTGDLPLTRRLLYQLSYAGDSRRLLYQLEA